METSDFTFCQQNVEKGEVKEEIWNELVLDQLFWSKEIPSGFGGGWFGPLGSQAGLSSPKILFTEPGTQQGLRHFSGHHTLLLSLSKHSFNIFETQFPYQLDGDNGSCAVHGS